MYYILINPGTTDAELVTDYHGRPEDYLSYEDAKQEAEEYKLNGDAEDYLILGECTDERNHII